MKRIFLACAGFCVLILGNINGEATADGPDYFRVQGISAGSLILRAAGNQAAPKIGAIPRDVMGLKNLGCKGGLSLSEYQAASPAARKRARLTRWCKVDYRGAVGWAAGWFLAESPPPPTPSFDCAKASGSAEKLVCAEPDLARLDQELDRLYRLAKAATDMKDLKAYQRSWIKGRDDCWKESDAVTDCVTAEYATRIHEIRVALAETGANDTAGSSLGPFVYHCDGMDKTMSAVFVRGPMSLASLRIAPDWLTLPQLVAASGARYGDAATDGAKITFWLKGADARFQLGRRAPTICRTEATN